MPSAYQASDELHDVLVEQLLDSRVPTYADELFPGPFDLDNLEVPADQVQLDLSHLDNNTSNTGLSQSVDHFSFLDNHPPTDNLLVSPVATRRSSVRFLEPLTPEGVVGDPTNDTNISPPDSPVVIPVTDTPVVEQFEGRYGLRSRDNKPPIVPESLLSRAAAAERRSAVLPSVMAVTSVKRSPDEPTMSKAMASEHAAQWKQAIIDEVNQIHGFGCLAFEDEGLPDWLPECKDPPLSSHFVLKLKRRADFSIDKFKARLVIDGNRQTAAQYKETAAPTGAMAIVLMVVALATGMGWHISSIDITGAFLHADIDCPIRVRIPSIDGSPGRIARLLKSIYGLKQAGRLFWNHLRDNLLKFGFKEVPDTECFYTYTASNGDTIWLLSHVDDLLLLTNNESLLKMVHDYLSTVYFKATLELKLSSHLGLKFHRLSNCDMFVSQPGYICHMLRTLNMEDAPPATCPLSNAPLRQTLLLFLKLLFVKSFVYSITWLVILVLIFFNQLVC